MADIIDDVKSKLSTTSMSDVVDYGVRGMRKVESGLQNLVAKGRKAIGDATPEQIKRVYRDARGYTTKRSQTRSR